MAKDDDKKKEEKKEKAQKISGGKKKKKNKLTSKKYLMYKIEGGEIKEKREHCPRCGPGIFLAKTKNGVHCGKCHYAEMKKVIGAEANKEISAEIIK